MTPYLSVVATSRNDNHGGTLQRRMQTFIHALAAQCQRHQVPAELILVEWNPPADRPPLAEALEWPAAQDFFQMRIIQVPAAIHARYRYAQKLPLYQMIAKNVGILRARGEYILATNIDILFSDELMAFFHQRKLQTGKLYRIDRWDVQTDVPVDGSIDEQLAYCQSHLLRRHSRGISSPITATGEHKLFAVDIARPEEGIIPGEGWLHPFTGAGGRVGHWLDYRAQIHIQAAQTPAPRWLCLEYEYGSNYGYQAATVEVRDQDDHLCCHEPLGHDGLLEIPVPGDARLLKMTIHPHLPRVSGLEKITNVAVFKAFWREQSAGSQRNTKYSIKLMQGWSAPQASPVGTIRRVRRRAVLRVLGEERFLELELVPAQGIRQLQVFLRETSTGQFIGWGSIVKKTALRFALPPRRGPEEPRDFTLEVLENPQRYEHPDVWVLSYQVTSAPLGLPTDPLQTAGIPFELDPAWSAMEVTKCAGQIVPVRYLSRSGNLELPREFLGHQGAHFNLELHYAPGYPPVEGRLEILNQRGELLAHGPLDSAGKGPRKLSASWDFRSDEKAQLTLALKDLSGEALPEKKTRHVGITLLKLTATKPLDLAILQKVPSTVLPPPRVMELPKLHTNGCGDFTLLARQDWMRLGAHPELDLFSMHQDSLFCFMAAAVGIQEEVLEPPMRIYHIEHSPGSGWTPEGESLLRQRLEEAQIREIDFHDLQKLVGLMIQWQHPFFGNQGPWGLADESLVEFTSGSIKSR